MTKSHSSPPLPSPLLCLVALGVVSRLRPGWLAVDIGDAACELGVAPERVSRLVSKAIALFERGEHLRHVGFRVVVERPAETAP